MIKIEGATHENFFLTVTRLCSLTLIVLLQNSCSYFQVQDGERKTMSSTTLPDKALSLKALAPHQTVLGYTVQSVYLNSRGERVGVRMTETQTGMPLDLLVMNTVPQMLIVVSTPPVSKKGESHIVEHLVLGKGAKGKYMSLMM